MDEIYDIIGGRIESSGMTTTCIMSAFRSLISHYNAKEEELNLMITGGPDGDLGANEIQCYKGNICLVIDGGSILFDPLGLDKKELMKIAFQRNSSPRANSSSFPLEKLSAQGFKVPLSAKNFTLPDGTNIDDGALFHRTFLANAKNRKYISQANIKAFIPCGGFKDTVNQRNVKQFLENFQELKFIVEGANVFFDDVARRYIATSTDIMQVKDSTANKGGVFSSSIAEVLTGFLFQEKYEEELLNDTKTRWALIKDILHLVDRYSSMETNLLLQIYDTDPAVPLFNLSEKTSEQIFALQDILVDQLDKILADEELIWLVMTHYVPSVLISKLGRDTIMAIFSSPELQAYRSAIVTKKLASMAFYRFGNNWESFLKELTKDFPAPLYKALQEQQGKSAAGISAFRLRYLKWFICFSGPPFCKSSQPCSRATSLLFSFSQTSIHGGFSCNFITRISHQSRLSFM
jgi:glutamate dehydrogenase